MDTFDYVIVGAGSAGSVLANRLSEDPATTLCVLEAGPRDWHPYIHLPAGFIKTFYNSSINWCYSQEPGAYTAGRRIYAPRGKTLGGSSSINGHIYNRGQARDFDTWAQLGNRGWGYADVLPYFKRLERRIGDGDDTYRGRDGALTVTDIDWHHPLCDAFIEGAVSLGIPRNRDYNGAIQEGVSYAQRTIHKGRRVSAATAFLHPASRRANVEVRTAAHATAIVLEGKRAVGVRYAAGGRGGVAERSACPPRGDPGGGHLQFPPAPAALRHRTAGPAAVARDRGAPCACGRRRGFAGPLRAAQRRPRQEHQDHQRAGARAQLRAGGAALGAHPARRALPLADARLLLLAFRRDGGELRPAAHLHARRATRKASRGASRTSPA